MPLTGGFDSDDRNHRNTRTKSTYTTTWFTATATDRHTQTHRAMDPQQQQQQRRSNKKKRKQQQQQQQRHAARSNNNTPPSKKIKQVNGAAAAAAKRPTKQIVTCAKYMDEDPTISYATDTGKQNAQEWVHGGSLVAVKGFQGSGKTTMWTRTVVRLWCEGVISKIVVVDPFTSLAVATCEGLRTKTRALEELRRQKVKEIRERIGDEIQSQSSRKIKIRVHLYTDPPITEDDDYDILVVCPMSLPKFEFTGVGLLVIDELAAVNTQLLNWGEAGEETAVNLNRAIDVLQCLAKNANTVLVCGAQADEEEREIFFGAVGIDPARPLVLYSHASEGPLTPVVVETLGESFERVNKALIERARSAINVRVSADGKTLKRALELKAKDLEWDPVILLADADWYASRKDAPFSNFTKWLTDHKVDILIYTNTVSPGIDICHAEGYWTYRFQFLRRRCGGAPPKVLGQMVNRVRHVKDRTVYMCVFDLKGKRAPPTPPPSQCMEIAVKRFPFELKTVIGQDGKCVSVLRDTPLNKLRLDRVRQELRRGGKITADEVIAQIGNAYRVKDEPKADIPLPPEWEQAEKERAQRDLTAPSHLTEEELLDLRMKSLTRKDPGRMKMLEQAESYIHIAKTVPPEFIGNGKYRLENSISPEGFACIDRHLDKLMVIQALATGIDSDCVARVGEVIYDLCNGDEALIEKHTGVALSAACAITHMLNITGLPTIRQTLEDLGAKKGGSSTVVRFAPDKMHCTKEQSCEWLTDHWPGVRKLVSRNSPLPKKPPTLDHNDWMAKTKRVVQTQTGLSMLPQRNELLHDNGWGYALQGASLWSKLQFDLQGYIAWFRSPQAKTFGISKLVKTQCDVCDGSGSPFASCVKQGDIWRCMLPQGSYKSKHRNTYDPLDVGYPEDLVVKPRVPATSVVIEEVKEETEESTAALSRFLQFIGLPADLSLGLAITDEQITAAMTANEVLTLEDQAALRTRFGLAVGWAIPQSASARVARNRAQPILKAMGFQLCKQKQKQRGFVVSVAR